MPYKCLDEAGDAYNMAQSMAQYRGGLLGGFLRGLSIFAFFFSLVIWFQCSRYVKEEVAPLMKNSNVCIQSINLNVTYRDL